MEGTRCVKDERHFKCMAGLVKEGEGGGGVGRSNW
jgi:hypothetical protein